MQQFKIGNQDAAAILRDMYSTHAGRDVRRTGKDAFEAMKMIQSISQEQPIGDSGSAGRRLAGTTRAAYGQGGNWAAICSSWRG